MLIIMICYDHHENLRSILFVKLTRNSIFSNSNVSLFNSVRVLKTGIDLWSGAGIHESPSVPSSGRRSSLLPGLDCNVFN